MGVKVRFQKGAWWVYIDHHGRRNAKRVGDKAAALRVAQAVRGRLARSELHRRDRPCDAIARRPTPKPGRRSLTGTIKASTASFYAGILKNHILPALGSRGISSVTRQDCRELIATCRAKGLSRDTVKGIVRALSTISDAGGRGRAVAGESRVAPRQVPTSR